jgi:hypothetical protein
MKWRPRVLPTAEMVAVDLARSTSLPLRLWAAKTQQKLA